MTDTKGMIRVVEEQCRLLTELGNGLGRARLTDDWSCVLQVQQILEKAVLINRKLVGVLADEKIVPVARA